MSTSGLEKKIILLPESIHRQLIGMAKQSPGQEICGLIGGIDGRAVTCYPIKNVAASPESEFLLDAKEHIQAIKTMREYGEQLFAIYHSHPSSPPHPSDTDLAMSCYPDTYYLIIGRVTEYFKMRCFKINDSVIQEINIGHIQ